MCNSWDKSVVPKITSIVNDATKTLDALIPGSMDAFKDSPIAWKLDEDPVEYVGQFVHAVSAARDAPFSTVEFHKTCSAHLPLLFVRNGLVDKNANHASSVVQLALLLRFYRARLSFYASCFASFFFLFFWLCGCG